MKTPMIDVYNLKINWIISKNWSIRNASQILFNYDMMHIGLLEICLKSN